MELSRAITSAKAQQSLKFNQALIYGYKLLTPTFKSIHSCILYINPLDSSTMKFSYTSKRLKILI